MDNLKKYRILSKKTNKSIIPHISYKRVLVLIRRYFNYIMKNLEYDKKISSYQEKAIKLWKVCLRDDSSNLFCDHKGNRLIENDNVLIIYKPHDYTGSIISIIDSNSNRNTLFDIFIPAKQSKIICEYFDFEMKKRMHKTQIKKYSIIEKDLDFLINEIENKINIKYK